jgi:hypothetical protein
MRNLKIERTYTASRISRYPREEAGTQIGGGVRWLCSASVCQIGPHVVPLPTVECAGCLSCSPSACDPITVFPPVRAEQIPSSAAMISRLALPLYARLWEAGDISTRFDRLRRRWLGWTGAVEAQARRSRAFPGSRWGWLRARLREGYQGEDRVVRELRAALARLLWMAPHGRQRYSSIG